MVDEIRLNIASELVKNIANSELGEIGIDIADMTIDKFIDYEVVKDIPVIGIVAKIIKSTIGIKDAIFLRKISRFLFYLNQISDEKRVKFQEKIKEQNYSRKVGDILIVLLDKFEDSKKADILAKCFIAYVNERITLEEFRRLGSAINIAFKDDIDSFVQEKVYPQTFVNLLPSGLSKFDVGRNFENSGNVSYFRTHIGDLLKVFCNEY